MSSGDSEFDQFLNLYVNLAKYSQQEVSHLKEHLSLVSFKKGDTPIRQGSRHDFAYYIIEGAARSYYTKDHLEVNTWFAFEEDIVASFQNYRGKASVETTEFLEDSQCIKIDLREIARQAETSLVTGTFVRRIVEEYTEFLEERLYRLQFSEGMERYTYILQNEPELILRVPLTYLASYLGMSRETLSRLRAKITL